MRRLLPLLLALPLAAQSPAAPWRPFIPREVRGERALETVAYLDRFVRWPGNRGYDSSIAHVVAGLRAAGYVEEATARATDRLAYRIERTPMRAPAWEPLNAIVTIVGDSTPLLRFATNRNLLATNSWSTPAEGIEAEVVDLGDGTRTVDVTGRIAFADQSVGRVFAAQVMRRGAIGALGYALPDYTEPEKHRTSIQFTGIPYDTTKRPWAVALSRDARDRLRAALAKGPVRVRVSTDVRWISPATELAVIAEVRGSTARDQRIVVSAHVQEPGANDNASGVGTALEMARVLARGVQRGAVNPARTITMLWGLEITMTARYLRADSVRRAGVRYGLSLDMVGENTARTGGTFLIEKVPDPSAVWTRGDEKHTAWGAPQPYAADRLVPTFYNEFVLARAREEAAGTGWVVRTNPFEGGSDHTPFIDAKIPGLLLWHFTDRFYHTDRDRLEMVSAAEMAHVARTALGVLLPVAQADARSAQRILAETERAAMARLAVESALSTDTLTRGGAITTERTILETWGRWFAGALRAAAEVEAVPSPKVRAAAERAADRVTAEAARRVSGLRAP
ncbi:MAG: M28 family peptidase [Gemmatimonadaceae bacterium]|nr:M28 family peptidase [Gemmatimonadaceae bacterium]